MSTQTNFVRESCPELKALPDTWTFKVQDNSEKRIYFLKASTGETSMAHPTLGGLPVPWILCICNDRNGQYCARYYNRKTKETTKEDPRFSESTLRARRAVLDEESHISGSVRRNTRHLPLDSPFLRREPISDSNIRARYDQLHAIDPGDGTVGGMNGGVFVVRLIRSPDKLYVEKRFKSTEISFAVKEINMLRKLKHGSLTFYTAAFVTQNPPDASVYVEFCDRGSLENIIVKYAEHRITDDPKPEVPSALSGTPSLVSAMD